MIVFVPVFEAHFLAALLARDTVDLSQLSVALVGHAFLYRFALGGLFGDTFTTACMIIPNDIGIFLRLHFDSLLANRTYYHVHAVVVGGKRTFMIVRSCMVRAKDLLASVTLKGQEVLLIADAEGTMLTNVAKFH